ncbi:MAG: hypothetical protein HY059_09955 [Proteobacteria bacterium]|nr:hypothetical protein [Pseudomonadota bacterium]
MSADIPSFKKDNDDDKGGGVPIPALSKTGAGAAGAASKPLLRVRGLTGAGSNLVERLKQFKKKDLAFILSGLGVLFMAPIAEHFILGPGDEAKAIRPGFDAKGNMFGDAGAPYEPGAGGFSPGGLPGGPQGTDVITPLNARDPSSLIMGPGATQQPAASATVTPPPATTPPKDSTDWGAVTRDAARGSSSSAGPPTPRGNLAGALRGLSALSGASYGGGSGYSLAAPGAANLQRPGGGGRSLSLVSGGPNYKGVASRGATQGGGNIEALRAAAASQAGNFNRGGAAGGLDQASREIIPGGRGGNEGGPGSGDQNKAGGNNSTKDNKALGESLAYLKAKMEMEKGIDLKWKKKEWDEFGKRKMIEETIIKTFMEQIVGKAIFGTMGEIMKDAIGSLIPSSGTPATCFRKNSAGEIVDTRVIPAAVVAACKKGGKSGESDSRCSILDGANGWECRPAGKDAGTTTPGGPNAPGRTPPEGETPLQRNLRETTGASRQYIQQQCRGTGTRPPDCPARESMDVTSRNFARVDVDERKKGAEAALNDGMNSLKTETMPALDATGKALTETVDLLGPSNTGVLGLAKQASQALSTNNLDEAKTKIKAAKDAYSAATGNAASPDTLTNPDNCPGKLRAVCTDQRSAVANATKKADQQFEAARTNIDQAWAGIKTAEQEIAQTRSASADVLRDQRVGPGLKAVLDNVSATVRDARNVISPIGDKSNGQAIGDQIARGRYVDQNNTLFVGRVVPTQQQVYGGAVAGSSNRALAAAPTQPSAVDAVKKAMVELRGVSDVPEPTAANAADVKRQLDALVALESQAVSPAVQAVNRAQSSIQGLKPDLGSR